MKRLILSITMTLIMIMSINAQEKEQNESTSLEELKAKIDASGENVTELMNDMTGLKKLKISGYIQLNYEKTENAKGFFMSPYDSTDYVQSRFRVRRSRVKVAYNAGLAHFVVQGDYSNAGFTLKDAYASMTDPWIKTVDFQMGVFNRPNFEVEYSSSQRESMERSSVIRALYPDERDLGAMFTIHPDDLFKLQIAGFNNTFQGDLKQTAGPNFNNEPLYFMFRLTKEFNFASDGFGFDLGVHARTGSVRANSQYSLSSESPTSSKTPTYNLDSTSVKPGDGLGRTWFGGEIQFFWDFLGGMKIMGEYITGNEVNEIGTASAKKTIRKRNFNGFYVYLVKNIGDQFQLSAKYDAYTPNTKISVENIDVASDMQFSTLALTLHNYTFYNIRLSLEYALNMTKTGGYGGKNTDGSIKQLISKDPIDNLLTFRMQFKF